VHSGAIVQELTYKHFGPTPYVFVSRQSGALAMVNCWRRPSENRADVEKPAQLLVFRLDSDKGFLRDWTLPAGPGHHLWWSSASVHRPKSYRCLP